MLESIVPKQGRFNFTFNAQKIGEKKMVKRYFTGFRCDWLAEGRLNEGDGQKLINSSY